jgi:hypothetical protein
MRIAKEDIGSRLWAVPTVNNWSRAKGATENEPKEIVITGMRRTRGEFRFANSSYEHEFSLSQHSHTDLSIHVDCGINSGYHIYRTLEDYAIVKKAEKAKLFISDKMRYSAIGEVPCSNIIEAAKSLGWEVKQ